MKRILTSIAVLVAGGIMSAQNAAYNDEMVPYPDSGLPALSAAPQGYELFYVSHYGRHGSRAMSASDIGSAETAWRSLSSAYYRNALTDEGNRLFEELDRTYRENKAHVGHLTGKGIAQHAGIAGRMAENCSGIFRPGARIGVMTSIYPRCIMSMSSFTSTLKGLYPGIGFEYDCYPGIQGYINPSVPQAIKTACRESRYYDSLKKEYDAEEVMLRFFKNGKELKKYIKDSEAFLLGLYNIAANSVNLDIDSSLPGMVPEEVMEYYGARHNRELYYKSCNSGDFGAERMATSDSLVICMLQKADAAVAGRGNDADLCFGHDGALAAYISHLDLDCMRQGLKGTDIEKGFRSSEVIPMAANLQQMFYRNSEGDVLVKFVLNEREVGMNGMEAYCGKYYRWKDVRERLSSQITPRREVRVEGGRFHVQGLAYDAQEDCMYMSFTSMFCKVDMEGHILASIGGINGHLGAMVFDPQDRKVYASLELKDDSIGRNISKGLGDREYSREESVFYVARIDVDRLTAMDMKEDGILRRIRVDEACRDYLAQVNVDGRDLDHRFACSGIDGMTIAPAPGTSKKDKRYLYVAYGVYGDVSRIDNDYNILLAYPMDYVRKAAQAEKPVLRKFDAKYFIHTGNTTWGIQNMAYDPASKKLFLAVYKGSKPQWPNHPLFVIDMTEKSFRKPLEGVPYVKSATQLRVAASSDFKWGSTGMCALGDGRFYISENGKEAGCNYCKAHIYNIEDITK